MVSAVETPIEIPPDKPKDNGQRIKHRINYALAATLLATGCDPEAIASQVGAKNWNSVRVGLAKRGVTQNATRALPPSEIVVQRAAVNIATSAVEEIRDRLTKELMGQVDSLASVPVRYGKLASKGQGRAAMVKTIAESFKALHGSAEMNVLVFGVDSMNGTPVQQLPQASEQNSQGVIDVPSE